MSWCLRASGETFDVDASIKHHPLDTIVVHRKGKPKYPQSRPDGPRNDQSSLNIVVSNADFDNIDQQIDDAIAYLSDKVNADKITKLMSHPGVDGACLDFGVELNTNEEFCFQGFVFPADLTKLAGELGLDIELSIYPS